MLHQCKGASRYFFLSVALRNHNFGLQSALLIATLYSCLGLMWPRIKYTQDAGTELDYTRDCLQPGVFREKLGWGKKKSVAFSSWWYILAIAALQWPQSAIYTRTSGGAALLSSFTNDLPMKPISGATVKVTRRSRLGAQKFRPKRYDGLLGSSLASMVYCTSMGINAWEAGLERERERELAELLFSTYTFSTLQLCDYRVAGWSCGGSRSFSAWKEHNLLSRVIELVKRPSCRDNRSFLIASISIPLDSLAYCTWVTTVQVRMINFLSTLAALEVWKNRVTDLHAFFFLSQPTSLRDLY